MTIFDPTLHQTAVIAGSVTSKMWSVNRLALEMSAAGWITLVTQDTTPAVADQGKVWLQKAALDAATGLVKIYNGSAWVAATSTLLLQHMGGITSATAAATYLALAGGTLTGALTLAADPVSGLQPATKQYADALVNGLDWKQSVRFVTTANDALSGLAARNGVTPVAGNRVGVIAQSAFAENGIYVAAAGAWVRATDADSNAEVTAAMAFGSTEGAVGAGATYKLDTPDPIVLGTTALSFSAINAGGATAASSVTFIPTGAIAASNVQAALVELDSEKLALTGGTMSGAIAMGTNKITGLSAAAANGDAVRYDEFTAATTFAQMQTY